jgi:putative ABC transport system substrate-binding protein
MLSAAQKEAPGIPIVFTFVSDPVGIGAVASLARPGGHITGFTPFEPSLVNKWLELLKEIAPRVTHAALLFNRNNPGAQQLAQAATAKAGIVPVIRAVDDMPGIEAAAAEQARQPGGALVFIPDQFNSVHRKPIVALAARLKLPAIYPFRHFADDGGLIAYGTNSNDVFRQVGTYVDRILRGANPGDLPVQSPTKFDLAINMTAAKALGLTIPPTLLVSADAVIE